MNRDIEQSFQDWLSEHAPAKFLSTTSKVWDNLDFAKSSELLFTMWKAAYEQGIGDRSALNMQIAGLHAALSAKNETVVNFTLFGIGRKKSASIPEPNHEQT